MKRSTPVTLILVVVAVLEPVVAAPPRTPFSGAYSATVGAGSLVGWERLGGDNPAIMGPPGFGAVASGYAPFGLDGLRVTEVEAFYDRARFGLSSGWRQVTGDEGTNASRLRFQGVWRVARAFSTGGFLSADVGSVDPFETGFGLGLLVHPHRFASVGITGENLPDVWGRVARARIGIDAGTPLPPSIGRHAAWRVTVEYARQFDVPSGVERHEWGFGFGLRLHDMMSVYAGCAPHLQTVGLGVRFGLGGFEGFSGMRRHAALGGTAIQGVGWSSARGGP